MKENETTNVAHIKACLAAIEAQEKEFNPYRDVEISIREHLKENGEITIPVIGKTKTKNVSHSDEGR